MRNIFGKIARMVLILVLLATSRFTTGFWVSGQEETYQMAPPHNIIAGGRWVKLDQEEVIRRSVVFSEFASRIVSNAGNTPVGEYTATRYFRAMWAMEEELDRLRIRGHSMSGLDWQRELMNVVQEQHWPTWPHEDLQVQRTWYENKLECRHELEREKQDKLRIPASLDYGADGFVDFVVTSYLNMFWCALVLYLLWLRDDERSLWHVLRNPVGTLLCLAFYPVVIKRRWARQISHFGYESMLEAEVRRGKRSIFGKLDESELELVADALRRGLRRAELRERLDTVGKRARRSFAPAIAATLALAVLSSLVPISQVGQGLGVVTAIAGIVVNSVDARDGPSLERGPPPDTQVAELAVAWEHPRLACEPLVEAARVTASSTDRDPPEHVPISLAA